MCSKPGSWGAYPKGFTECLLLHFHLIGVNLLCVLANQLVQSPNRLEGGCFALLLFSGGGVRGERPLWRASELPVVRSGGKVLYPLRNGAGEQVPRRD